MSAKKNNNNPFLQSAYNSSSLSLSSSLHPFIHAEFPELTTPTTTTTTTTTTPTTAIMINTNETIKPTFKFKVALSTATNTVIEDPVNTNIVIPLGYIKITGQQPSVKPSNKLPSEKTRSSEMEREQSPGCTMYYVIEALEKKWKAYEKAYNKMNGADAYAEKFRWAKFEVDSFASVDTEMDIITSASSATTVELSTPEKKDEEGINEGLKTPYFST